MDATTAQPTLLSAAKNFMRKSAGKAALAIVPLAAVALASEAKGQIVFETPHNIGSSGFSFLPGTSNIISGGYFSSQLPDLGGIAGFSQGVNVNFNFSGLASGSGSVTFPSVGFTGTISATTMIPVTYSFTFSGTGSATLGAWTLYLRVSPDSPQQLASGSGFGTFSDTVTYTQMFDADGGAFDNADFQLAFDYTGSNGDNINLIMNPASQGLFFNATAIPEPSTYAGLLGLGALGLALVRRWRRTLIA